MNDDVWALNVVDKMDLSSAIFR